MKVTALFTGNTAEPRSLELHSESTVADVITLLGIPGDEAGLTVINGKAVSHQTLLSDGDTVKIFPVIIGG
ncbi:MAG: MoaD/ThiS family protein [Oscillospiraceae bacterium]|nr:MoaD/ThiS family protein [Oscillospiraceae bacterium]